MSGLLPRYEGHLRNFFEAWQGKTDASRANSGLLFSYEGHLRILFDVRQGKTDTSRGEGGGPGSLSSSRRDIGIPINVQQELGIPILCRIELRVPLDVSKGYEASFRDEKVTKAFPMAYTGD
ncbi:unnamed protein product [Rangifer tarandus platyrhynchus]|uniref:Uncharacterized protein n=1 Tax=Rangifer tarandus platyrhynchus TaxID=3082113 RepID=A0ABN8ZHU3_RANTA|nr:unnamed protein product [Rangifer tarandus platyrhynchus]